MSMLAGPRQKKRYHLVPKGKALFEDGDRFGTKMLEKMGWSKGKGLGSREDGQQEFIRVRYKNDANGLGFEDRDDQWKEHEKHFNGLLENLNGGSSTSSSTSNDCEVTAPTVGLGFQLKNAAKEKLKDKISGQSLEEKSKNSKARVHYKKFTKGKDMTQYSEKDLANIFGKKPTPDDNNIYKEFQAFNAGVNYSEESKEENIKESKKKNIEESPIELGTQIINTGVSVNDYFKMKMAALKEKKSNTVTMVNAQEETANDSIASEGFVKKKSKKRVVEVENKESTPTTEEANDEVPKKKKKNKKQIVEISEKKGESIPAESEIEQVLLVPEENVELIECAIEEDNTCKKKKSKKSSVILIESDTENPLKDGSKDEEVKLNSSNPFEEPCLPKTKKSKKHSTNNVNEEVTHSVLVSEEAAVNEVPLKKKKNKKRSAEQIVSTEVSNENTDSIITIPEKKKKAKPSVENLSEYSSSTQETIEKSSKKNQMSLDSAPTTDNTVTDDQTIEPQRKKNKKKNKTKSESTPIIEVSSQHDLNHLKDNCLLDTYTISTFCAEKFRNIELHQFYKSSLLEINGYGLSENLQLTIKTIKNDQERIMRLWNGTLDKYQHATPKHKLYSTYMTKAKQARQSKNKIPKMKMKCLKRKHVFQCL